MFRFKLSLFFVIGLMLFLAACGSQEPAESSTQNTPEAIAEQETATPMPTETAVPTNTATATPVPTNTATPTPTGTPTLTPTAPATNTPTPTMIPTVALGEIETSVMGFSYQPPTTYLMEDEGQQIFFQSEDGLVLGSLTLLEDDFTAPLDDILAEFITGLADSFGGTLEVGESEVYVVDEVEGASAELSGTVFDFTVSGRAVAVVLPDGRLFFAFSLIKITDNETYWLNEGEPTFKALIDSVIFDDTADALPASTATPATTSNSACPVSTDSSYGYTQGNPIRVGGDAFGGPARARAYLDNLRGPNGEIISYSRDGSVPTDTTILDAYSITGLAQTVTLYVDQYSYETLLAPVGFTCSSPFPIIAP